MQETELAMRRRLGSSEHNILATQGNIADSYLLLGRKEEALCTTRDVYLGFLKLYGKEHEETIRSALCWAFGLHDLRRHEEAKKLLRKTSPVARRVLGETNELTLKVRWVYASVLCDDPAATLDDLREAVSTLEETARTARRVLGISHPVTEGIEAELQIAREDLRARETPSASP